MGDRASVFRRRHARRLSDGARAALDRAPVVDDGPGRLQTSVVGLDPLRVLLFGSGPLIGYGVRTRSQAVDGWLAALLAERTGRGVIVESRVRLQVPIRDAVRSLGGAGTATFHVAVWAPGFGEELQRAAPERGRAEMAAMLREFREESAVPLVVCQLPRPLGFDWRTVLRRPRVAAFNRMLAGECARWAGVAAVDIGTYRPAEAATTVNAAWQRRVGDRLGPAVLQAMGIEATGGAGVSVAV